jgi:hypothetical protein
VLAEINDEVAILRSANVPRLFEGILCAVAQTNGKRAKRLPFHQTFDCFNFHAAKLACNRPFGKHPGAAQILLFCLAVAMQSDFNAKTLRRKDAKEDGQNGTRTNAYRLVTRIGKSNFFVALLRLLRLCVKIR